jgi:hypothetical protein
MNVDASKTAVASPSTTTTYQKVFTRENAFRIGFGIGAIQAFFAADGGGGGVSSPVGPEGPQGGGEAPFQQYGELLPSRGRNSPTDGIFIGGNSRRRLYSKESGSQYSPDDPSPYNLPSDQFVSGKKYGIYSHVEAKAARLMRESGIKEADLVINNFLCAGRFGCQQWPPRMLPSGSRLRVHIYVNGKYDSTQEYVGE